MNSLPPIEVLRETVLYNPDTGILTWLPRKDARPSWNARFVGKPAMHGLSLGYRRGYIFRQMTLAHRVAFALSTGRVDFGFIDHINGDRSDNRLANLREVSRAENAKNKAKPSNGKSGFIGVSKTYDGKWRAHITNNGVTKHLGRFASIEQAISARRDAELKLGFHPNHGRQLLESLA